ncbi:hypothetical protein EV421DRAFT_1912634 [Armillaria borealis]|uniref:Uncharacterized protein n=1 Tax=Armillaria borealis TaxID=47425 RepID=A0AA39IUE3_9AGAR|nr:hypothetical protein EV421DRAFT_1912634 [Armillaria borealis]
MVKRLTILLTSLLRSSGNWKAWRRESGLNHSRLKLNSPTNAFVSGLVKQRLLLSILVWIVGLGLVLFPKVLKELRAAAALKDERGYYSK